MHKVFISYHHALDQFYKDSLLVQNARHDIFIDSSVDTGDVSDSLTDESIRVKIRDEYLRDSSVTILLVGAETRHRKHVDWELYSSMFDGPVNKKSGILVINLPNVTTEYFDVAHKGEKEIYSPQTNWITITTRAEYERRYPAAPARIVDNLLKPEAKVSVTNWNVIDGRPDVLRYLIDAAFHDRTSCQYDLTRPMRRTN